MDMTNESGGSLPDFTPAVSAERMLANMRSATARNLPIVEPCRAHGLALSIAGGGPSLADTYQDLDGWVCAVNGSLRWLLERGVNPSLSYACGIMDAGDHIAEMIAVDPRVRYYVASICDPSVFDKLKDCDVRLWHVSPDSTEDPDGVQATLNEAYPFGWFTIGGGCTMGLRWIDLGYVLGFRRFKLHGMDSSFRGGNTHAYPDRADTKDRIEIAGRVTRPNFLAQVRDLFRTINRFSRPEYDETQVAVFGDGLLQDEFKEWMARPQWNCPTSSTESIQSSSPSARSTTPSLRQPLSSPTEIGAASSESKIRQPSAPLVCCVKTGTKYGNEYVTRLRDGVAHHLSTSHRFVCFTDHPVDGVECHPLPADLPGWWAKIGLFKLQQPLIYFDLDVVITGDLSPLLSWNGFGAIKDWWQPGFNSSVMKLTGHEYPVWEAFERAPNDAMRSCPGGDQQFVTRHMPNSWTFPPEFFASYKANHCVDGPPDGAMACIFHGRPKPFDLGGWVERMWKGSPEKWVDDFNQIEPPEVQSEMKYG
jgi:hypothetical protein